uniref:Uncharacterized protein n=1 Tax=Vespula pensylvanica TaxID=30213 RepID=A0A834KLX9_VESPE|nr:hypothetical protein H0235_013970 [Vespula pensylvanica]
MPFKELVKHVTHWQFITLVPLIKRTHIPIEAINKGKVDICNAFFFTLDSISISISSTSSSSSSSRVQGQTGRQRRIVVDLKKLRERKRYKISRLLDYEILN